MAVGGAYVFPGFLTPVLTQLFFPKPSTTFLTCLCRGERRKYAVKKSCLNRGLNSQPPGHESDTLTTELPRQGKFSAKTGLKVNKKKTEVLRINSKNNSSIDIDGQPLNEVDKYTYLGTNISTQGGGGDNIDNRI